MPRYKLYRISNPVGQIDYTKRTLLSFLVERVGTANDAFDLYKPILYKDMQMQQRVLGTTAYGEIRYFVSPLVQVCRHTYEVSVYAEKDEEGAIFEQVYQIVEVTPFRDDDGVAPYERKELI